MNAFLVSIITLTGLLCSDNESIVVYTCRKTWSAVWPIKIYNQTFLTWGISSLLTEVFPRDLRQKERFLKHLTGEQMSVSLCIFFIIFVNWQQFKICLFVFLQDRFILAPNAANTFINSIIIPGTAQYQPVSAISLNTIIMTSEAISRSVTYWLEIFHF